MKLLVFDIDGTLTSTNAIDELCFVDALESFFGYADFSRNWSEYQNVSDGGISEEIALTHWGRRLSLAEKQDLEYAFIERLKMSPSEEFKIVPGAIEFLVLCKESARYSLAIATGCWESSALSKLERVGIDCSDIPLSSSSYANERTDIMFQAQRLASQRLGISRFDEVLYFGDALWDLKACRELGWRMIGIGDDFEELKSHGIRDSFRDYTTGSDIIEAIEGTTSRCTER